MSCPDPENLLGLIQGRLSEGQREEIEQHIDRCTACRKTLAALAKSPGAKDRTGEAEVEAEVEVEVEAEQAPGQETAEHTVRMDNISGLETLVDPLRTPGGTGEDLHHTSGHTPQLSPDDALHLQQGELFADRFLIEGLLGHGGMGAVYLASHTLLQRRCALKLIRPELTSNPEVNARFQREAMAASKVNHPHVADVFDFGHDALGRPYLVMEYIEGPSLAELIAGHRLLPLPQAVKILLQVAKALAAAHAIGVVHRDLKPQNILLARRPGLDDSVKILDFGLAKFLDSTNDLTAQGAILGTVLYMSPEQLLGQEVDHRTDIYSFGVLAFELICGETPFQGEVHLVAMGHLERPPPAPSSVSSRAPIPAPLERMIAQCLRKDPGQRYQDSSQLIGELQQLQAALEAEPPPGADQEATRVDRRPLRPNRIAPRTPEIQGERAPSEPSAAPSEPSAAPSRPRSRSLAVWLPIIGSLLVLAVLAIKLGNRHSPTPQKSDKLTMESDLGVPLAQTAPLAVRQDRVLDAAVSPRDATLRDQAHDPARAYDAAGATDSTGDRGAASSSLDSATPPPRKPRTIRSRAKRPKIRRAERPVAADGEQLHAALRVAALSGGQSAPADVYLDGKLVGQSPLELTQLQAGRHRLLVIKEGFLKVHQRITLKPGMMTKVIVHLKK